MEAVRLAGLEPASVFSYFEKLCSIPHGSGNTKAISDYLVSFAQEHGLRYEQDDLNKFFVGDVDLDGKITIKDATMIQKALADLLTLSYESETLADVDRDGKITIKDATAIQKYIAGLESGTAVGILLGEVKG